MRSLALLLAALLTVPGLAFGDDEPAPTDAADPPPAATTEPPGGPPLDLRLHRDPTGSREDQSFGAVRITAKLDTTKIYLDGVYIGAGEALVDRVIPGVHSLEARLASGREMNASILVRPGSLVEYDVIIGSKKGEKAYAVLMNVAAIVGAVVVGSAAASTGSAPIPTDVPGLITGQDAINSGNRKLPRP